MNLIEYFGQVGRALQQVETEWWEQIIERLLIARIDGNTVFVIGNGGSSSRASHLTQDLVKQCSIRSLCLTDSTPLVTAYANDDGYHQTLVSQLEVMANPGDVLIAISTSGESPNLLFATRYAPLMDVTTIAFTGHTENTLWLVSDLSVRTLHDNQLIQEDVHGVLCHALIDQLKEQIDAMHLHSENNG